MRRVDIAGCPVGAADRRGWVDELLAAARSGRPHHHVSLNAGKWVAMTRDVALREAVLAATSVAADGVAIVLASRWLGDPLPERVPGIELAEGLLTRGLRVYLLGARPAVVARVAADLRARGVDVVGAADGYFTDEEAAADAVARARPELLLVALGTPTAEIFVHRWGSRMGVPLAMGVGGAFDVWAGEARRAPRAVRAIGLEWAWRWAGSPRARFSRAIVDSARFVLAMARWREP
jgi:N-acetylglucosaminyldiphosphoundecaprenol N-acetyl-beta-D-mannosaminyltransferase